MAAPVAKAAALAAWPEGNDVVNGATRTRRTAGTLRSDGRGRRTTRLMPWLTTSDVTPIEPRPRTAARCPRRPPPAARHAAIAIHRPEWFAERESSGNPRSSHGVCPPATRANSSQSSRTTGSRRPRGRRRIGRLATVTDYPLARPAIVPHRGAAGRYAKKRRGFSDFAYESYACPGSASAPSLRSRSNERAAKCGGFPKPSAGLEQATPSLPWKPVDATRGLGRIQKVSVSRPLA